MAGGQYNQRSWQGNMAPHNMNYPKLTQTGFVHQLTTEALYSEIHNRRSKQSFEYPAQSWRDCAQGSTNDIPLSDIDSRPGASFWASRGQSHRAHDLFAPSDETETWDSEVRLPGCNAQGPPDCDYRPTPNSTLSRGQFPHSMNNVIPPLMPDSQLNQRGGFLRGRGFHNSGNLNPRGRGFFIGGRGNPNWRPPYQQNQGCYDDPHYRNNDNFQLRGHERGPQCGSSNPARGNFNSNNYDADERYGRPCSSSNSDTFLNMSSPAWRMAPQVQGMPLVDEDFTSDDVQEGPVFRPQPLIRGKGKKRRGKLGQEFAHRLFPKNWMRAGKSLRGSGSLASRGSIGFGKKKKNKKVKVGRAKNATNPGVNPQVNAPEAFFTSDIPNQMPLPRNKFRNFDLEGREEYEAPPAVEDWDALPPAQPFVIGQFNTKMYTFMIANATPKRKGQQAQAGTDPNQIARSASASNKRSKREPVQVIDIDENSEGGINAAEDPVIDVDDNSVADADDGSVPFQCPDLDSDDSCQEIPATPDPEFLIELSMSEDENSLPCEVLPDLQGVFDLDSEPEQDPDSATRESLDLEDVDFSVSHQLPLDSPVASETEDGDERCAYPNDLARDIKKEPRDEEGNDEDEDGCLRMRKAVRWCDFKDDGSYRYDCDDAPGSKNGDGLPSRDHELDSPPNEDSREGSATKGELDIRPELDCNGSGRKVYELNLPRNDDSIDDESLTEVAIDIQREPDCSNSDRQQSPGGGRELNLPQNENSSDRESVTEVAIDLRPELDSNNSNGRRTIVLNLPRNEDSSDGESVTEVAINLQPEPDFSKSGIDQDLDLMQNEDCAEEEEEEFVDLLNIHPDPDCPEDFVDIDNEPGALPIPTGDNQANRLDVMRKRVYNGPAPPGLQPAPSPHNFTWTPTASQPQRRKRGRRRVPSGNRGFIKRSHLIKMHHESPSYGILHQELPDDCNSN